MRILWLSNSPLVNTGYGTQTRLFTPRIRDLGHDVEIIAFWGAEGSIQLWEDMRVWPKGLHKYGVDVAIELLQRGIQKNERYDCLITLIDAWVMNGEEFAARTHWAPWHPSDSEPLAESVRDQLKHAHSPLVFTEWQQRQLASCDLSSLLVPHGFDSSIFYPQRDDALREKLRVPRDAFLIGIFAANKGRDARKGWYEQLAAVSNVMKRHDDVYLYLHSNLGTQMQGVPIETICKQFGVVTERTRACDQFKNITGGFSDEEMAELYSQCDVLLNVSHGEGFGLPILEAQACGTPVIVGDWTAMSELRGPYAQAVQTTQANRYAIDTGGVQFVAHEQAIADKLEVAYQLRDTESKDRRDEISAWAQKWEVESVMSRYWRPALETIEQRINAEPSIELTPAIAPHDGGAA